MQPLSGTKQLLHVLIAITLLFVSLLVVMQVVGAPAIPGMLWTGYPLGLSGQINFMWDVVRLSLSRIEPARTLVQQVRLWNTGPWVYHFSKQDISVPRDNSYGMRTVGWQQT